MKTNEQKAVEYIAKTREVFGKGQPDHKAQTFLEWYKKQWAEQCNQDERLQTTDFQFTQIIAKGLTLYSRPFKPEMITGFFEPNNLVLNLICYNCDGGKIRDFDCPRCNGKGYILPNCIIPNTLDEFIYACKNIELIWKPSVAKEILKQ